MLRTGHWEEVIDALDPQQDAHAIVLTLVEHVFGLDILLATELGQLRTFSIPSISRILHATRQYEDAGPRRLDDTKAILTDILQNGVHSSEGAEMIAHLNAIHSHYRIANDDYIYTLSALFIDIDEWLEEYGWRTLRDNEREAMLVFHLALGEAMGIKEMPSTWPAWREWRRAYEERVQRHHPANTAVAQGFLSAVATWLPRPLRGLSTPIICALMPGDGCLRALDLQRPAYTPLLRAVMALRRRLGRWINPWQRRSFTASRLFQHYPTYPKGFERLRVGPEHLLRRMDRSTPG